MSTKGYRVYSQLTQKDHTKIRNRFFNKIEEFKLKSLEELEKLYDETKMSSTDRNALLVAMSEIKKSQKLTKSDGTNDKQSEEE